jgi:ABC-2 type transport system permease protein
MNTPSNAMPDTPLGTQGIAPAFITETRPMYWSVRRELWENRYVYVAPLAVAAITVFGFVIATIGRAMSVSNLSQRRSILQEPYTFAMDVIMGAAFIVGIFYSLDALHGERRDRSILFWKSLPVSDLTTVLSKAAIPLVVLPLLTFAIVFVTQLIMLLLSSVVLLGSHLSAAALWTRESPLQMSFLLLYHMVTVHVLWYAPIYAWMLLVSAWAKRATFLWAALPPVAICILEKITLNTSHFAAWLGYRASGAQEAIVPAGRMPMDSMTQLTPGHFLSSPGLWMGLIVAAGLLAATVRLRRHQGPI